MRARSKIFLTRSTCLVVRKATRQYGQESLEETFGTKPPTRFGGDSLRVTESLSARTDTTAAPSLRGGRWLALSRKKQNGFCFWGARQKSLRERDERREWVMGLTRERGVGCVPSQWRDSR